VLQVTLGITEFVNADEIARGLSGFNPEGAAMAAGRVMLTRLRELAEQRLSFAFETTLASRSFAPWLQELKRSGYMVYLVFFWLPSADVAVARVAQRVGTGGHHVPADAIRRRYRRGLRNFLSLYGELATSWRLYDSSSPEPRLVTRRLDRADIEIYDQDVWTEIARIGGDDEA
jgi:predicted ABC-type ATPase